MHPSVGIAVIWSLSCASMSAVALRAVRLTTLTLSANRPATLGIRRPLIGPESEIIPYLSLSSKFCHSP